MQKVYTTLACAFSLFIVFVIYGANTGIAMPAAEHIRSIAYGDKLAHFMLFGFLSFLLNLAFTTKRFEFGRFWVYRGSLLVGTIALLEELTQHYIPTRAFEFHDLLADFCGIVFFAFLTALYARQTANRFSRSRN